MTTAVDALRALLDDVCMSAGSDDLSRRWGSRVESLVRPGGIRAQCPPECPFQALEMRPWATTADVGVVDVELRGDARALELSDVRCLGELSELPAAPDLGGARFALRWPGPPQATAEALLVLDVDDATVTAVTIRRDPRA